MNTVLPYVGNRENFMSHLKFSMKENRCKTLDFDCWVNDFMAMSEADCILTNEGYEVIKNKYSKEIDDLLEEMRLEHEREEAEAAIRYEEHADTSTDTEFDFKLPDDEELPF